MGETMTSTDATGPWHALWSALHGASPDGWRQRSANALEQLHALGLPTRGHELYKYLSLRALTPAALRPASAALQSEAQPGPDSLTALFLRRLGTPTEGGAATDGLPQGVRFLAAPDEALSAAEEAGFALSDHTPEDGLRALRGAMAAPPTFLSLARDTSVTTPILLRQGHHFAHDAQAVLRAPTLFVHVARGASLTLVSLSEEGPNNVVLPSAEVILEEGATLRWLQVQQDDLTTRRYARTRVLLRRDAHLEHTQLCVGAKTYRHDLAIMLDAPGAEAHVRSLSLLRGQQQADHSTLLDHRVAQGTTSQDFRAIVDERAHSVFHGRIIVHPQAQKTSAEQLNKNLQLSPDARVDTRPQLEIFADDVKCAHGATLGRLQTQELFYLTSRGLHPDQASALLVRAFGAEVLESFSHEQVREVALEALSHLLGLQPRG